VEVRLCRPAGLLLFTLILLHGTPAVHAQVTAYVDDDNCPGPGSGTDLDPFCTIQDAICDTQSTGGTVLVRPGYYNESIRMLGGVSVVSTDGFSVTTIDATGRPCIRATDCLPSVVNLTCAAVVFGSESLPGDRLEGFEITGGEGLFRDFGTGNPPNSVAGGGVFVFASSPIITNNEIVGNALSNETDDYWGGGIYLVGLDFYNPSTPTITGNLIEGNVANSAAGQNQNNPTFSVGGGIYVGSYVSPLIEGNTIRANQTGDPAFDYQFATGGGIASYAVSLSVTPVVSRNLIEDNIVAGWVKYKDEPLNVNPWTAEYKPWVVEGDRAIAVGETHYEGAEDYFNSFQLVFRDGKCVEFTEWFMEPPEPE